MRDVLYYPARAQLAAESLPDDLKELGEGLLYLGNCITEVRNLAGSLSRGELNIPLPTPDNEMAATLKALHATLKHLTWQAQQVAKGDYDQHIKFMGEFSEAFNEMIAQLRERRDSLALEMETVNRQTQELERSNSLFEVITSNMSEWIVMVDKETGEHLFANHTVQSVLTSDVFEEQLYDYLMEYARGMGMDDEPRSEEFTLISDTALQYFEVTLYYIKWYQHDAVACVLVDITQEKEEYNRLEDAAYKDMATGVFNRHYGMKTLEQWLAKKEGFSLIFIDMDMLKYVNDVFGHQEGDIYIQTVADLLGDISPMAVVCRLGGDEFMVLLQERDKRGRGMPELLEGLRNKLIDSSTKGENGEILYNRSLSFGIVDVGKDNVLPANEILSMADERMYEYKKAHKKERRV
ncbi:MAG: diguanylate cyclase [Clostridiales Family XIII bacterium]|jgi:diguanylate cyclase (GGDEF)-like protein|nr:diguanylate cyclase [Clostridiales Family XIII bacterium]